MTTATADRPQTLPDIDIDIPNAAPLVPASAVPPSQLEPPRMPRATFVREDATPVARQQVADEPAIMKMSSEDPAKMAPLFTALAAAQAKFKPIEKKQTAKTPKYSYDYATLDEVLLSVREALSENGLAIMQFPQTRRMSMVMRTMLVHTSGQWIYNELTATIEGTTPQAVGSGITYLRRYGLQPFIGVAPSWDDDGEAAGISSRRDTDYEDAPRRSVPQPAPRRSEQPAPAKTAENVGVIKAVLTQGDAKCFVLDNGFRVATRDAELITAMEKFQKAETRVEITAQAPNNPKNPHLLTEVVAK